MKSLLTIAEYVAATEMSRQPAVMDDSELSDQIKAGLTYDKEQMQDATDLADAINTVQTHLSDKFRELVFEGNLEALNDMLSLSAVEYLSTELDDVVDQIQGMGEAA